MKTKVTTNSPYTSRRTAEITIWLISILIATFLLLQLNAQAITPVLEEECYIDDIPFNTSTVVDEIMLAGFFLAEDNYVDDIPFDTESIVTNYCFLSSNLKAYELSEERPINDIPFNTKLVKDKYMFNKALTMVFYLPGEDYVDDIPFNTHIIVSSKISKSKYSEVYAQIK